MSMSFNHCCYWIRRTGDTNVIDRGVWLECFAYTITSITNKVELFVGWVMLHCMISRDFLAFFVCSDEEFAHDSPMIVLNKNHNKMFFL